MLTTRIFEFPSGRFVFAKQEPFRLEDADDLPQVPSLPETLLVMELQLHGRSIDLREVAEAVLRDLGATLQILRLAGREYGDREDRPVRIEDCIADLGLESCLRAAESATLTKATLNPTILEMWAHAREIAQCCRLLTEEESGIVHPYEAYLAGLVHGIGALPAVLGWKRGDLIGDRTLTALTLAQRWAFPACLKDFFGELHNPGANPQVSKIVARAHELVIESSARCLPVEQAVPSRAVLE